MPSRILHDLKEMNLHEIKGYWLAYKDGVYDISAFVENHPGGKQILKTAGKALEACWKIFTIHRIDHVYEILEEYRIGNLPPGKEKFLIVIVEDFVVQVNEKRMKNRKKKCLIHFNMIPNVSMP